MDDSKTYHYKVLQINGKYILPTDLRLSTINISSSDLSFITPFFEELTFVENFKSNYELLIIPQRILVLLEQFLSLHKLETLRDEFVLILSSIQKEYIFQYEDPFDFKDKMSADFQNMKLDVEKLLDVLYSYLQNANYVNAFSIKFQKIFTVKNIFLIRDVLNSIVANYGLTLENFDIRKKEILDEYLTTKLALSSEKFKYEILKGLTNFVRRNTSNSVISNKDLKFAGSILHLAQISISARANEIILTDPKNLVLLSDIKNLRKYLERPERFSF